VIFIVTFVSEDQAIGKTDGVDAATNLKLGDELFPRDASLFQDSAQRANRQFSVSGNDAPNGCLRSSALQNNVAGHAAEPE
jgi:hypothetical protein